MAQVTIKDVFQECQKGMHSHGKLVKNLTNTYNKIPLDEFFTEFIHCVKYSLIIYRREPAVERTLDFSAKFVASFVEKGEEKKDDKNETEEELSADEEGEEMHPLVMKFFNFLLEHHNAKEKAVRFRCCQMINKLLNNLSEEAQIDDDLYDKIYECMLQRLRDKFPSIRVQAVLALSRLQDPRDMECPIIKAYLFLLSCDTNPDVRRSVLGVIAASTKTLAGVLDRTRDVKDMVRKLAYQVIAERIHIRALTIAQRVRLLHEGLNDRIDMVREACSSRMLQSWLRIYEGNILELLKALDVENSLDTSEQALKTVFKKIPVPELISNFDIINDEHVIVMEELTSEAVLYWRCLAQYIQSLGTEAEEQLEKILPNGTVYSKFMTEVLSHMKGEKNIDIQLRNDFILQQLLNIAQIMDLSDEVSRKNVLNLLKEMLLCEDVTHTLVKPVLDVYTGLITDQDQRIQQLVELISDIRMPITVVEDTMSAEQRRQLDLKLAGVRVKLNQMRDELEDAIQHQEFTKAAEIKASVSDLEQTKIDLMDDTQPASQEVRTEKNDPDTLLKCLTIAKEMLLHLQLKGLKPELQSLIETLILPGVTNAEPAVRNVALNSLGLCCLLDKETARKQLLLFVQVCHLDVETVKVSSLQIIFDILLTFGLDAFGVDSSGEEKENLDDSGNKKRRSSSDDFEEGDNSRGNESSMLANITAAESDKKEEENDKANRANSILTVLIGLIDSQSSEVRTVVAEGLAKLMLSGRVVSSKLLSRLLLLWYNPITEDDNQLRHCLGAFFPVYAFAGRSNQTVVEEAFMLTLKTLFNAPATSPLAEVNVTNVAELLVELTNDRHLLSNQSDTATATQDSCSHDNIAVSVCNEILKEPNSFNVRALCRIATLLELCPNNYTNLKDLKVLSDDMVKEVKDKQCLKLLEKFQKQVWAMLKTASENGLLNTPLPRTPAARTKSSEEDSAEKQDQEKLVEEGDKVDSNDTAASEALADASIVDTADTTLLEDGQPDTRKYRKGKKDASGYILVQKALRSICETTPVNTGRSKRSGITRSTTKKDSDKSDEGDVTSNINTTQTELDTEEVFASPTPVRQSTRSRKPRASATTHNTSALGNTATKKNLKDALPDSDTGEKSEDDGAPTSAARSTRSTRVTRARNNSTKKQESMVRSPLNEKN